MDTLDGTTWDVVIAGTGLHESLLALALSRTGKKVLHVDKNGYYGGSEAALSLQEFQNWADEVGKSHSSIFSHVTISSPDPENAASRLSFPRAYSLALAPQLIYARSQLLPALVSARVESQLEFLAMGSWWTFDIDGNGPPQKVPSGREELFASQDMTATTKRSLIKFLRFVADSEAQQEVVPLHSSDSFDDFLQSKFGIAPAVQQQIHALVMSASSPHETSTELALSRITTHLQSIGIFGPGFGAVIPKWGGLAEIAQVGCRAGAVGGGVYVLDNGIASVEVLSSGDDEINNQLLDVRLARGDVLKTSWVLGSFDNLPSWCVPPAGKDTGTIGDVARSITIVSSSLPSLFGQPIEGAPPPAGAVVVVPQSNGGPVDDKTQTSRSKPVYIIIHASDTGECPSNQCVLYASTAITEPSSGLQLLERAVDSLVESVSRSVETALRPQILWQARYIQHAAPQIQPNGTSSEMTSNDRIVAFPPLSTDLVFDDETLATVRGTWRKIVPDAADADFLQFAPRGEELDDNE